MPSTKSADRLPAALTVAGSDSGGDAGIQGDLKTFSALGVFGATCVTCVTAQDPKAVARIYPVAPEMAALQIRAAFRACSPSAVKTGMLYTAAIIEEIVPLVAARRGRPLVVDPVMISTSGARLLRKNAVEALCSLLLPAASLATPNMAEAAAICGYPVETVSAMKAAAVEICSRSVAACVVTGGHLAGGEAVNVLCRRGKITMFPFRRAKTAGAHGTGCVFSAAAAAMLARGASIEGAVKFAGEFAAAAKAGAVRAGRHLHLDLFPRPRAPRCAFAVRSRV